MSATAFKLSLRTITPVVLSKWLTLDAMLDGILTQDGVEPEDRELPLLAWDGARKVAGLTAEEAKDRNAVFMASATFAGFATLAIDQTRSIDGYEPRITVSHPPISSVTWKGGANPRIEFNGGEFPFAARGKKFDTTRGETGGVMRRQRTILPTKFEWLAQGDPDRVLEILALTDGIGAKTRNGYGEIDRTTVEITRFDVAPELYGIVDIDGHDLARPVPASLFEGKNSLDRYHHRVETCVPPYWNKANEVHALVPKTQIDSLLTITGA